MSEVELSAVAKALLKSAKLDGPSALAKSKIWVDVATAAGGGPAVAGGASVPGSGSGTGAGVASGASAKLLAAGALFGSAVTVGLAMTLLRIVPVSPPTLRPTTQDQMHQVAAQNGPGGAATVAISPGGMGGQGDLGTFTRRTSFSTSEPARGASAAVAQKPGRQETKGQAAAKSAGIHAVPPTEEETLMREASLVAEARGALRRGDPGSALRAIQAARQLPVRQLVPEEMSLEAQALRATGKSEEADRVNGTLKAVFPDHALAR